MYALLRIIAVFVWSSGRDSGQYRYAFVYRRYAPDMEFAFFNGFRNFVAQHQVLFVLHGNHYALTAGQAVVFAVAEESLDFFVDAAYRLYVAALVDGTVEFCKKGEGKSYVSVTPLSE